MTAGPFDRELLNPVRTHTHEERLAKLAVPSHDRVAVKATRDRFPAPTDLVRQLRRIPPLILLDTLAADVALKIVDDWLAKNAKQTRTPETEQKSRTISANVIDQVRAAKGYEHESDVSPVEAARCLFELSKSKTPNTWSRYRSAILQVFCASRSEAIAARQRHGVYDRALGTLIIVTKPPFEYEAPKTASRRKRRSGIPLEDLRALFEQLKRSNVPRSLTALAFAEATLMTGARLREWADAEYFAAPTGTAEAPRLILTTGKRKIGADLQTRTLLLMSAEAQLVVSRQIENLRREFDAASICGRPSPLGNLIKKCSQRILDECMLLWPNDKSKWLTLYNFRHQARANFVQAFGQEITAALMGHGLEVGRKNYAPQRKAHKGSQPLHIKPGQDILDRAAAMKERNQRLPAALLFEQSHDSSAEAIHERNGAS